jgi:S1-C subfamily serine protease
MKTFQTIIIGFIAGLAGAYVFYTYQTEQQKRAEPAAQYQVTHFDTQRTYLPNTASPVASAAAAHVDFSDAAAKATPSVVYINSISQSGSSAYSYWDMLFGGGGQQTQVSSGSGVIFAADGYIVTNNHVVESAEKIQVIYNKKVYDADLIGTDPSTDLGVLKIKEDNLPAITLGSSKDLAVGEWVVAIGNPFSLSSTVTAGIVSAKGRRINIVEGKFPIESFIQTDAAINPGNSGGALVNRNGDLVGINAAILSRTGSYTGYAFAIPVDIAKKVVGDIIKYGAVQKGIFGGSVVDYDYQNASKFGLNANVKNFKGVLLEGFEKNLATSAAREAGLRPGDIIIKVNDTETNSESEFEEELSYRSPGDKVTITYIRDNQTKSVSVVLLNKYGDTNLIKRKFYSDATVGATMEEVDYGVKVFRIKDGLFKKLGVPENYTIISINRQRVKDPQDVIDFFGKYKGRVLLYGMTSSKQEMPLQFILQ